MAIYSGVASPSIAATTTKAGQQVTGGCVNVAEPVLQTLLAAVKLGDEVVISAKRPCTP